MNRRSEHAAFTMTELLVLLGMIGMAAAVSAVAIEKSRESSNRVACVNNLKLLGLAAHQYHDEHKSLPPGWWGSIGNNGGPIGGNPPMLQIGPGNGPLPQLLPFLNSQKLFGKRSFGIPQRPHRISGSPRTFRGSTMWPHFGWPAHRSSFSSVHRTKTHRWQALRWTTAKGTSRMWCFT